MSNIIQPNDRAGAYSTPAKVRETKQTGTYSSSLLNLAARASRGTTDVLEINSRPEIPNEAKISNVEAYKKHMAPQQETAAQRRILTKLRMNGGSVCAAELLMGLL